MCFILKKFAKRIINDKSGFRFRRTFFYMRHKYGAHWALRLIFLIMGILVLLAGLVMIVTPGPGWLTILLGVIIIACVSYRFARRMDRFEKHILIRYRCYKHRFRNLRKKK